MNSRFLDTLKTRVLLFDGAMGTSIQTFGLNDADFGGLHGCNEILVRTRPDVIEEIHARFFQAGCDAVETDTFNGTRLRLAEYGLGEDTRELNRTAAAIARTVADRFSTPEHPRFVVGSCGPTGRLPSGNDPVLSKITFDELADTFAEQGTGLVEGGADVLLLETSFDVLELKAGIAGFERAFRNGLRRVPVMAQVFLVPENGKMLFGTDIAALMTTLQALPIHVIGLNCSAGPEMFRDPIGYLTENASLPVSCLPNAGLPEQGPDGEAVYRQTPDKFSAYMAEFVRDFGVNIVGGCCGTTHEHMAAVNDAIAPYRDKPRRFWSAFDGAKVTNADTEDCPYYVPGVSSGMRRFDMQQVPAPLIVGERVNSVGSRKIKRLLLKDDYNGCLDVAREQVDGGAHVLDVCVAMTERQDERDQMVKLVKTLAMGIEAPLVIDTTEADVMEAALKIYPGRAIVNSINLENRSERVDKWLPILREHGAAVVAMTIDENGMAKTAEAKFNVARKLYDIVVGEYGMTPDTLIYDVQVFPVVTGQEDLANSAVENLNALRRIKAELPGTMTILGVSNLSFGISPHARAVLNSVFLHHAVKAGLDMAIVNPAHITPYSEVDADQRDLADDLVLNRRPDALARYIGYFETVDAPDASAGRVDPMEGLSVEERIHYRILHRKRDGVTEDIETALSDREAAGTRRADGAIDVLNNVLLPAMKEVGDKFGAGELILPFVLQSAEVMKASVAHLEQYLEKKEGSTKGKLVLATVFGDVHDIGKSLVNTILSNNGYTVYDLGKQVPINTIIEKAVEVGADAIGLSALLVSTSKQMPLCVKELDKRGLSIPVIIGGAAINPAFGHRALYVAEGRAYNAGIYYCKDAFEGLDKMDRLTDGDAREALYEQTLLDAARTFGRDADKAARRAAAPAQERSKVADAPIPTAPFWGTRVVPGIPLSEIWPLLDLNELYRLQWGAKNAKGDEYEALKRDTFEPKLAELKAQCEAEGWLAPKAVYGYFPARREGESVVVFDPADHNKEVARFDFPRQAGPPYLCLSDYLSADRTDVLPLQVVTVGPRATEICEALNKAGDYSLSYFLHGLSVETAEATAEWMHRRIADELGIPRNQGHRYSWGYPACPDLEQHHTLFTLLPAGEELGMEVTEAGQLVPDQSTAALVIHHPDAIYFGAV
ncbi:MAG TPA: methionine synthase [Armatimonadota bacterium]|jgi:5-methyltetrahydrofolate--homocysteine methyltransferase